MAQRTVTDDALSGLYDGFEGYRTPTAEDYRRVFSEGMVVTDANVLLNLYRYTDQARDDLLSVLERLGDQLWVPHQVLVEFWRNRDAVLRDPRDTGKTAQEMSEARDRAVATFRAWANRVSLPAERLTSLAAALTNGFDVVIDGVDGFSDTSAIDSARNTDKDAVLKRLETILDGRVGGRLDDVVYSKAVEEGLRRVDSGEPPGYMDKKKDDSGAAGDYLVWEQVLIEAERRSGDVVFVTGDVKDDWWRKEGGEQRGPRMELVEEMRRRADSRLLMLRPTILLSMARELLAVTVHDESVEDADRVDRLLSDGEIVLPDGGWNTDSIVALLNQLGDEAPVQEAAITHAAYARGFINREKVYEIGDYPTSRSLRGFTRPINRIAQLFREEGRIHESAVDLLNAVYDQWSDNPSAAIGFELNSQVVPLVVATVSARRST
jgi:PIN like domain